MSIASEITRIRGNISDSLTAVSEKGVSVPINATSDDLADLIAQIQSGSVDGDYLGYGSTANLVGYGQIGSLVVDSYGYGYAGYFTTKRS